MDTLDTLDTMDTMDTLDTLTETIAHRATGATQRYATVRSLRRTVPYYYYFVLSN